MPECRGFFSFISHFISYEPKHLQATKEKTSSCPVILQWKYYVWQRNLQGNPLFLSNFWKYCNNQEWILEDKNILFSIYVLSVGNWSLKHLNGFKSENKIKVSDFYDGLRSFQTFVKGLYTKANCSKIDISFKKWKV